jgi:anti-sigma factor RsiW
MNPSQEPGDEPVIARDATYYRAPDALRQRIRVSLAQEAREKAQAVPWWRWGGMAASFALAALLTWNGVLLQARNGEDRLAGEIAGAHVRSLLAESHLNDVVSTDQHTVKPWFQGRIDFAPAVSDLAAEGFPLTGGRLDYINGRPVAALTYRHRLHVINLFEWPASAGDSAPETLARQGYALVHWKRGGIEYWAVSDAAAADMLQFAKLLSAA